MFRYVSKYSFEGDLSATLNSLTNLPNTGLGLESLSENYTEPFVNPLNPNESPIRPNPHNQQVLMNQPMSWWLENLNSGTIHYFPFTNYVNWTFNETHIDREISDLIIPNECISSSNNILVYREKFGLTRTDSQEQPAPEPVPAPEPAAAPEPAPQPEQ
jgi:hypothetical protein